MAYVRRIESQRVYLEDVRDSESGGLITHFKTMPAGDWSEFLQAGDTIEFTASAEAATPWRLGHPRGARIRHRPAWDVPTVRRDHPLSRTWDQRTEDANATAS